MPKHAAARSGRHRDFRFRSSVRSMTRRLTRPQGRRLGLLGVLMAVLIGTVGIGVTSVSASAAPITGWLDSAKVSGGKLTVHGWAVDPTARSRSSSADI